jgi:isocitrate dehydrogenase
LNSGKIYINEILTDAMFERSISHPEEFDIVVTTNLNGDYLADALAALVGGIGIAPGGNINYETGVAVFEATHGTAPSIAGKDMANPCSLLLSGVMLLNYLGWVECAQLIEKAIENAIRQRVVTFDFFEQMENAELVGTHVFADQIIQSMRA